MSFESNDASLKNLEGVHPDLVRVVTRAAETTRIYVAEGLRSKERAASLAKKGTGIAASLHIRQTDGYSHAVDLWPSVAPDWNDLAAFRAIAKAMFEAADELGILLQWGADWDTDGKINEPGEWDYPHFQLPQPFRRDSAKHAADRRRKARFAGEAVLA